MQTFRIQYLGEIEGVGVEFDMASRSRVLKTIDLAKRNEKLPRVKSYREDAILKMDEASFKVVSDDQNEDILARMPLHQVSTISYVFEDQQHIIAIKYGEVQQVRRMSMDTNEEMVCSMVVLLCSDRRAADDICNAGELMFEEAMKKQDDQPLPSSSRKESSGTLGQYSFLTSSCNDLRGDDDTINLQQQQRQKEDEDDEKDSISSKISHDDKQVIMEYMQKLYKVLDRRQLELFAGLMNQWHNGMPLTSFLSRLTSLYPPQHHQYLLSEMRPFIPAKDLASYDNFMTQFDD